MMEEKFLIYLRENNPELYQQAISSINWAAEWRDKELAAANAELAAAVKKVEDFDLVVVMNKKICSELDAAKARVAELEQQQFAGQTWVTFNEHMEALNKIKQMEDAIKFDFERFMEFQRRAEQAEARIIGLEKELADCKKMEDVAYQLRESLREEISSANARIAELEATLNETYTDDFGTVWTRPTACAYAAVCKANDKNREAKEQAEAQCAAMRDAFEQLSLTMTRIEKESFKSSCYDHVRWYVERIMKPDFFKDAGIVILAENERMRDALEEIASFDGWKSDIAKAALEEKP